jgi:hypothetical protein
MKKPAVGVRWTLGNVSDFGFEALRLSIWGAWTLFGPDAAYAVCVNSVPLETARERTGQIPATVAWQDANAEMPRFLAAHFDAGMAEGVGWKFAPLRLFPDRFELALDNDCILWKLPAAVQSWLEDSDPRRCLTAEDVVPMFGKFESLCGSQARNGGIRGLPPALEIEHVLRTILTQHSVIMSSELDEQGLNTAALRFFSEPHVVALEDVTICSPFRPHLQHLGACGAHFCGLNARKMPWQYQGRNGAEHIHDHWKHHRQTIYERVGISTRDAENSFECSAVRSCSP